MATWSGRSPGSGAGKISTLTLGPSALQPPAQASQNLTRSASPRESTSARRSAGAGLAEPDALGKPPRIDERPEGLQNSGGVQVHRVPAAINGQPHEARIA